MNLQPPKVKIGSDLEGGGGRGSDLEGGRGTVIWRGEGGRGSDLEGGGGEGQ